MVFFINMIIKSFFINVFSIAIFYKINNRKFKLIHMFISCFFMLGISILYATVRKYIDVISAIILNVFLVSIILKMLTKERISKVIIGIAISNSTAYVLYAIAVTLEYPIQLIAKINIRTVNSFITFLIESIFVTLCMKARKLKNGLQFLQNSNEYIETLLINISLLIIVMYSLVGMSKVINIPSLYVYFGILCICMVVSISKVIKMYYKQKLTNDTIGDLKSELNEKDNEIKRLTEENFKVHKVNHEFYNKQKALEKMVRDSMNMESGEELAVLERIKNVTKEHSESMESLKSLDELQHTEIPEIDDMFSYMRQECVDSNIEFALRVRGNIFYMINNLIAKEKLETMIGDHIRDAIIAVNSSDNKNKKIFVSIGKESSIYELCIFDTGIEFEIDTLNRLGIEQITTHKEEGGTGIGFISTFETMRESKASLEIEEIGKICSDNYTKAVKIIFDGKNEYRIKSYRKDELNGVLNSSRIKLL